MINFLLTFSIILGTLLPSAPQQQELRAQTLFASSDMEIIVTTDRNDCGVGPDLELTCRISEVRLRKFTDNDPYLITIDHQGERKRTLDTTGIGRTDVLLTSSFTDEMFEGFGMTITRKNPRPTSIGSVGTPTNDATVADSATSVTTGTFTPSNNLIVLSIAYGHDSGTDSFSVSDTFADTLTCDLQTNASGSRSDNLIFTCTGWTSGSGTITVTDDNALSGTRLNVSVDTYPGVDTTTPVSETNFNDSTTSTLSVTLTGITGDNRSHSAVTSRQDDDGVTPGTGETEIVEVTTGAGGNRVRLQTQYAASVGNSTDNDWSDLNTDQNRGGAIELAAAGGAAPRRIIR